MKPILVLGPEEPGAPSLERGSVDVCRVAARGEVSVGTSAYESVIVINDGSAGTIRRVQMALDLRTRGRPFAVGVLTYLAGPAPPAGSGAAAVAGWLGLWPQLKVELKESMLALEYQSD